MAEQFQTVAKVGEIGEGQGLPVDVDGVPIAVFLCAGTYYAVDDNCPHQGAPLCDGLVFDKSVACSWHGWRFSLVDGKRLDAKRGGINTYPIRVVGDEVQVALGAP